MWAQFWGLGSVSWIGVLSVHIILQVLNPLANYKKYMILYHLYVWATSLITSIIIVASDSYGIAGDGTFVLSILKKKKKKKKKKEKNFFF